MKTRRSMKAAAFGTALLLVLAACSGGSDDAGVDRISADMVSGVAVEAPETESGFDEAAAEDRTLIQDGAEPAVNAEIVAAQVRQAARQIIFTAQLTVAVTDVAETEPEATRIVEGLGGFLFGQQSVGLPEPSSVLIYKVDPARFHEALDALGELGEVRSQNVAADDVTDRIVDLESRISTSETSVVRLRQLLAEAESIDVIASIESQLLQRETELETMRAQLRALEEQVALATITVTLTEALSRPQVDLAVTAYPGHGDAGESCPGDPTVSVEEGDPATVCFEITNVGDMPLAEFEVRDTVLDLETGDMIVVFGDPESTLEPGQFLILAAEITPERTLRTQTRVTAAPVNADGETLDARRVSSTNSVFVEAIDPGGLPGFGDGLSTSVEFVQQLGGVAVLLAGIVIPLLWLPLLAWLVIRWRRNRRPDHDDSSDGPRPRSGDPAPSGVAS